MKKIATLFTLSLIVGVYSSQAQTSTNLYYDANGTTTGIGGTGNWTTTGANWTTSSAGTAALVSGAWTNSATWTNSNANNAILQGTVGTVSISSTIYANQIQVNTTGFTIQNPTNGTTSANRYFRTKNGIILASGVNLNVSSGITTNGAITGFEGPIVGGNGTSSVSTDSSVTITGATLNSDSSVRIAFDGSATDVWVPLTIATTGFGYASLKNVGGTNSIYGAVTVNSGSRLTFGANTSSRRINVRGNLSTVNTDLTIGESGDVGMIALYGNNSIGGNVLLKFGQLGYATNTAFGNATVVISDGTTFGQQGTIGTTDADRTLANKVSLQGNVTLGTGSFGNYFSGSWDLNNASRTITMGNSSYFSGSVTNGSLNVNNSSATRELRLSGPTNNLAALTWTQGIVSLDSSKSNAIGTLTMNGQTNTAPVLFILNPAANSSISTGGALVFSGTNNSLAFSNNALPSGTYTLLQGTSLETNSLSQGGLTLKVVTTTTGTNTATNTFALNGSPVTWQRYTYAFSNTPTALMATLTATTPDIGWSGGIGNWNTDPSNQVWSLDGISTAFNSNDNVNVGTEGTLNVDNAGVTAGFVTISGVSNSVIQGGALTALSVTKTGTGTNTFSSAATLSQGGLTVGDGVMIVAGALSYTNDTVINGGTLQTFGDQKIPDQSFVRINTTGATFRLGGNETVRGLEGVANSIVDLPAGTTLTMGSDGTSVASTNFFNITGAGTLVKTGTNQVSFRGNNVLNTFTVSSGRADLRGSNTINTVNVDSGAILGYGGTNQALGSAVVNLSQGSSIGQIFTMGTTDADRTIANKLNVYGDINLGISSYGNYFSGNVDLTGGERALTLLFSSYFYGSITNGNLVVDISNTSTNSKFLYLYGTNSFSNRVTLRPTFTGFPLVLALGNSNALGSGKLTLAGNAGLAAAVAMTITNAIEISNNILTVTNSSDLTLRGPISGAGGQLIKGNTGTLTLAGEETYTGTTAVQGGTLVNVISNLTATITPNTLSVVFSNTPVANGDYPILPGALTGSYSPASTSISSNQIISLNNGGSSQPAFVTVASKLSQTITGLATNDTKTFGDSPYTLNVTKGASTSSLTFVSDNTGVATVSSAGLVTIIGTGSATIRVNQAGDNNYLAASEVTQVLTVAKATPSISVAPTATAITSGQALSSSTLSGGTGSVAGSFAWTSPSTIPSSTGSFSVTFTPTDSANYNTATTDVSVTVNSAGVTPEDAYPGKGLSELAPNGMTYLVNYAFGGDSSNAPKMPSQDVSDPTKLSLVAYVRTNDSGVGGVLSVKGQTNNSLSGWSTNTFGPSSIPADQSDAPAGTQKQIFSVPNTGDRLFLRLKVTK